MSKLNSVRFINISYNYNMAHISDETLQFNGESTLLSLRNGGGKTVMIQLLTGLFVSKRYRNVKDRPFASYFTSNQPSFIMAEWLLDQGNGYLLTGMMVRRGQQQEGNEEELDMINFISHYKSSKGLTIANLPVIERQRDRSVLKSYGECKQLFEAYKRDKTMDFKAYDMNNPNHSKSYFDTLQTYGIDCREWQTIMKKINEDESGLAKLFTDCRDQQDLLEKWFLDIIERKLEQGNEGMGGFRKIVLAFAESAHSNRRKSEEKAVKKKLLQELELLERDGLAYKDTEAALEEQLQRLVQLKLSLQASGRELTELIGLQKQDLLNITAKLKGLKLEEYSAAYYDLVKEEQQLDQALEANRQELAKVNESLKNLEEQLNNYIIAGAATALREQEERLTEAKSRLQRAKASEESLEPERRYLGYLINKYYEAQAQGLQDQQQQKKQQLAQLEADLKELQGRLQNLHREQKNIAKQQGILENALASYDAYEADVLKKYGWNLQRNYADAYEQQLLDQQGERLSQRLEKAKKQAIQLKNNQIQAEAFLEKTGLQLKECSRDLQAKEQEQAKLEAEWQQLEEELSFRRGLLGALQLKEEDIYNQQLFLAALREKSALWEQDREKLGQDLAIIRETYEQLESGKNIKLVPELLEALKNLEVPLIYGMEWLRHQKQREQLELLDQQPFLPYSLLVKAEDYEKIIKQVNIPTPWPIPLVIREDLKASAKRKINEGFYMVFDKELLTEEGLKAKLAVIKSQETHGIERLDNKKAELQELYQWQGIISRQITTMEYYKALSSSLSKQQDLVKAGRQQVQLLQQQLREKQQELKETSEKLALEEKTVTALESELTSWQELVAKYARRERDREDLAYLMEREKISKKEEADLNEKGRQLAAQREKLQQDQRELTYQLKELGEKQAPLGLEIRDNITWQLTRYRAITEEASKDLLLLEEQVNSCIKDVAKAKEALNRAQRRHPVAVATWQQLIYKEEAKEDLEDNIKEEENAKQGLKDQEKELELKLKEKTLEIRQLLQRMAEECEASGPLGQEQIYLATLQQRRQEFLAEQAQGTKNLQEWEDRKGVYEKNLRPLGIYEAEVNSPLLRDYESWPAHSLDGHVDALIREHQRLIQVLQDQKVELKDKLRALGEKKDFAGENYQQMLEALKQNLISALGFVEQLRKLIAINEKQLQILATDLATMEDKLHSIINIMGGYLKRAHDELEKIDNNSSINLRGRNIKLLRLQLPIWKDNELRYRQNLEGFLRGLVQEALALMADKGAAEEFISKKLTLKELYHNIIGMDNIHLQLYKLEENREVQISWQEVCKSSGAEGFLSAFIILSSLLYYMRHDDTDIWADKNEGKVLVMDNPFGKTSARHLLQPMMELARRNNTQLICFSGLGGEDIHQCFNNIYVLNLVPSIRNNLQLLKGKRLGNKDSGNSLNVEGRILVGEMEQGLLF